jgi:predicted permease
MKWWQFKKRNADLERELRSDLELEEKEQRENGVSSDEAHYAALRSFGNPTLIREQTHATWPWSRLESFFQDLRYGLRGMRRNAGSTIFAILIVGLGIGGASIVFSVVNALLLRPLPFRDPAQLVWISNESYSTQSEHFVDLRAQSKSFSDIAGWSGAYNAGDQEMTGTGAPERITSIPVTENFFTLLGVEPVFGRSFTKEECEGRFSAPSATLLSYSFWRTRFGADPSIVGRTLTLNNRPVTIVGILPASFDFASIFTPGTPSDIFIPWPLADQTKPGGNSMFVVGRLKPGATIEGAQSEFKVLAAQLMSQYPKRNPIHPWIVPLEKHVSGEVRPALVVLMCAVGLVMLIVCANLSHLQMARIGARQKEMSIRAALGAGRLRLLRQVLTESVTLSCCGAALGVVFAVMGTHELAHLNAFNLPLLANIRVDGSTLAFALTAAILTGVLFGLAPALQVPIQKLREGLQDGGRESSSGRSRSWLRDGLVISQFGLACVLLVGAALLIQSFLHVLDVNLGFKPERAAALRIDPSFNIPTIAQQDAFIDEVLHRTRSIPGISAAGIADVLPLDGDRSFMVSAPSQPYTEAFIRVVSDGYFQALGVPLREGREFTEGDRASTDQVVMVNETLARTMWPGQDAIGRVMPQLNARKVVGVVADVHHGGPERSGGPEVYLPMRQTQDYAAMKLIVRTTLPPASLADGIRTALRPIDPSLPVTDFQTLQELVDKVVSPRRFLVLLLTAFAGFALLLASLGIYALISYSVAQRTNEIGIRMALGASRWLVQRDVLARTLQLAFAGVAIGSLGSFVLGKWIQSLLFDTTATNPLVYCGVSMFLCAVALGAAFVPARRASRIEPLRALRSE